MIQKIILDIIVLHLSEYLWVISFSKEAKQLNIKINTGQCPVKNLVLPKEKSGFCPQFWKVTSEPLELPQ